MTDLGGNAIEGTTGMPFNDSSEMSVLPPKEELPTCFEVKARILDFYPITLDEKDCLLRVCGDCETLSASCVISFIGSCLILP